jgi:tetratricopeptide (TPR) repeat protein
VSRVSKPTGVSRQELLDEAEYVQRSIEDLESERTAGELDGTDYEALHFRYAERARELDDALGQLNDDGSAELSDATAVAAPATRLGRRRWLATPRGRLVLGWSAVGSFVLAALLVGLSLGGVAPFSSAPSTTISVATQIRIELAEAGVLASNRQIVQAVAVYDRVLELDPNQPEALANGGWLTRLAGLSSKNARVISGGDEEIVAAVRTAPGYALARAYDGVALYEDDHRAGAAVNQFRQMLADKPSATLVRSVRGTARLAYRADGVSLPAVFAAQMKTTTSTRTGTTSVSTTSSSAG